MAGRFFLLDDRFLSPVTKCNIFNQIVVHSQKEWVTHTVVAGRLLMEHGRLTTIDEDVAWQRVRNVTERFWRDLQ